VKRNFLLHLPVFCLLLLFSACAPSNQLRIPGGVSRPPFPGAVPAGPPAAAVWDFSFAPPPGGTGVIGRDHDRVREVRWEGDPGRAMADLVAGVLTEQGVPTVRVRPGDPDPGNVPWRVSGAIRRFEANVRGSGVMLVTDEASVSLTVRVSGPGMAAPYETTVTSGASMQEMFAFPSNLRQVLLSASNGAAEEAVRGLRGSGMSAAFPKGGGGTAR